MGNSTPPDLDSTSKLLGDLGLDEPTRGGMNADAMDTDLIVEVPDTPERLGMRESPWNLAVKDFKAQFVPSLSNLNKEASRNVYSHHGKDSEHHDVAGSLNTVHDAESLSRRARIAHLMSKSIENQGTMSGDVQNRILKEKGKTSMAKEFGQTKPFFLSHPTQSRDSLRENREDLHDIEGSENSGSSPEKTFESLFQRTRISPNLPVNTITEEDSGMSCGGNASLKRREKGKGIDLGGDSQAEMVQGLGRPLQLNASRRNNRLKRLVRNGCISPYSTLKNSTPTEIGSHPTVDGKAIISSLDTCYHAKGKGIDLNSGLPTKMGKACLRQSQVDAPLRRNGKRRMVLNRCFYPINTVKDENTDDVQMTAEKGERIFVNELSDQSSSRQTYTLDSDLEAHRDCKDKRKVVMDDNALASLQHVNANSWSTRAPLPSGKELSCVADSCDDPLRSPRDRGWRTTRNHRRRSPTYQSCEPANILKEGTAGQSHESFIGGKYCVNVGDTSEISKSHQGIDPRQCQSSLELESEGRRHHGWQKRVKGRRTHRSARYHFDGCSGSTFDDSEILFLQSPGQPSNPQFIRSHNSRQRGENISGPVIDVDELPSPVRCSDPEQSSLVHDDFSARDREIESDEILARLLQEQFYNEPSEIGCSEEIDATIAWSLQQEETAARNASVSRGGEGHPRDTSIAHLYAHYPRLSPGRYVSPTVRARVPTATRMAQLRRSFRSDSDLETRLNFLEALETAFDNRTAMAFPDHHFQVQHNFNENDYEMLLALDDNNHQNVGALDSQINNLPQSVIQSDNFEEACVVCLEIPTVGETIRHLPCLHKFHKDCIDTWLRRKRSCPVCKSSIT